MKAIQKIEALVYIFDHRAVNFHIDIPDSVKFEKILPSVLKEYQPAPVVRAANLAWTICYQAYQKSNPGKTLEDFKTNFVGTPAGVVAYQEALNQVSTKIKLDLTVEDLESLYKESSSSR